MQKPQHFPTVEPGTRTIWPHGMEPRSPPAHWYRTVGPSWRQAKSAGAGKRLTTQPQISQKGVDVYDCPVYTTVHTKEADPEIHSEPANHTNLSRG